MVMGSVSFILKVNLNDPVEHVGGRTQRESVNEPPREQE